MQLPGPTPRLLFRHLTPGDISALHAVFSDPVTMQFWPAPFELVATERWVRRALEAYPSGFGRFAIILKSTGALIGDAGILRLEVNGTLENDLGYIIEKSYWRQGLGTEAAAALLEHGRSLGLQRMVASMESRHTGSRRVAEKIGFRFEREFLNSRNRNLPTTLLSWSG